MHSLHRTARVVIVALALTHAAAAVTLQATYGPPAAAHTWTKYTIPLVADTFGVDSAAFDDAMGNVTVLRIRTEMHNGADRGGVDSVVVGERFASYFDEGLDGWSSGGDGSLYWNNVGGLDDGGFLDIQDWAAGDWHYVVAPLSWAGDWRDLIGRQLSFYYTTDYPDYEAVVEIITDPMNRIILSADPLTVAEGDSTTVTMTLSPAPPTELTVSLTSSGPSCLTAPASVVVPAEQATATFVVRAASGASAGCESVIEATAGGYTDGRLMLHIPDYTVPDRLVASFAAPESTGVWTEIRVPLTAAAFGENPTVFRNGLAMVRQLLIGAELSSNPDTASLDSIRVGARFESAFTAGIDNWSILNDATLKWEPSGGRDSACITVLDWATGQFFYAVSPPSWAGDWSALYGDTVSFFLRVNHNDYDGTVELVTGELPRLFFTIDHTAILQGDSSELTVHIDPAAESPVTIALSSSNTSCITLPPTVTIPAASASVTVMAIAADESAGCESVVEGAADGYASARLSLTSTDIAAAFDHGVRPVVDRAAIRLRRNSRGRVTLTLPDGARGTVRMYGVSGRCLRTVAVCGNEAAVRLGELPEGIYVLDAALNVGRFTRALRLVRR